VDTNGGSCVRQASAGSYSDAAACSSVGAAYAKASTGDRILLRGGTYGGQSVSARSLGQVVVSVAPNETASIDGSLVIHSANVVIEGGGTFGVNEPDRLEVFGEQAPASGTAIDLDAPNVTVEDVHTRNFFWFDGADNGGIRYSEVGPSDFGGNGNLCGDLVSSEHVTGAFVEYSLVHDNKSDGCGGAHIDAFDVNFTDGVIRGNRIWWCGTQCIFTGDPGSMLIEHNVIEETNACGSGCGGPQELAVMGDTEIRYNTIEGGTGYGLEPDRPGNANVHHNVFLTYGGCSNDTSGAVRVVCDSNVFPSGGGGTNAKACVPRLLDGTLWSNVDRQARFRFDPADTCSSGRGASDPKIP
jgi:hypothetical protein